MARHLHDRGIVLARSGDLDQAEQALSASLAARPAWSGGRSPRIADLAEVQASGGEIEHAAGLATEALAIGVQTGSVEQRRRVLRPWSRLKPHPRASPCGSSASSSARSAWPRSSSRQDRVAGRTPVFSQQRSVLVDDGCVVSATVAVRPHR
jgi:hypothetical protein